MSYLKFFENFITEATFRNSSHNTHIMDVPMFSIFTNNKLNMKPGIAESYTGELIRNCFNDARNQITKLGFPSMHANVILSDLSGVPNPITGKSNIVAGQAHEGRKYMEIDIRLLLKHPKEMASVIVHEWSHLWMYNNSKAFKTAVREYYEMVVSGGLKKINPSNQQTWETAIKPAYSNMALEDEDLGSIRDEIANIMKWVNGYGVSNDFELWATAMQYFDKLPKEHQRNILRIMQTR